MSLSTSNRRDQYTGNGSTNQYDYTFRILSSSHLEVVVKNSAGTEVTLAIDDDYTVDSVGYASGGGITLVDNGQDWIDASGYLDTGWTILIQGATTQDQDTDIRNQGEYYPNLHEQAFDKLTMIMQELSYKIRRAPLLNKFSTYSDIELPEAEEDNVLVWDSLGNLVNLALSDLSGGTYTGISKKFSYVEVTTDTTIGASDEYSFYNVNSPAASRTITLPSASAVGAGKFYYIADVGNNAGSYAITVQRAGSDTIQGNSSVSISASGQGLLFVSDGTSRWYVNTIKQGQINSTMLASSSVTTAKINDLAVTTEKIADGAVYGKKIVVAMTATKTANYTATTDDDFIPCDASGGAFSVTMFNASSAKKMVTIQKISTDTSFGIITIKDSSAATITTINTFGETVVLYNNGSGWYVADRYIPSVWTSYTPTHSAGCGTVSAVEYYWNRSGAFLNITGNFAAGTVAASVATVTFPTGLTAPSWTGISTYKIFGKWWRNTNTNSAIKTGPIVVASAGTVFGFGDDDYTTGRTPFSQYNGTTSLVSSAGYGLSLSGLPISGWNG